MYMCIASYGALTSIDDGGLPHISSQLKILLVLYVCVELEAHMPNALAISLPLCPNSSAPETSHVSYALISLSGHKRVDRFQNEPSVAQNKTHDEKRQSARPNNYRSNSEYHL